MATIVFVHGTGTRELEYAAALRTLQLKLREHTIVPCLWGDVCGAKLHLGGKSIPEYQESRPGTAPKADEVETARWWMLYQDPLFEIRLLEGQEETRRNIPGRQPGAQAVDKARKLTLPPEIVDKLKAFGLAEYWDAAYREVVEDAEFAELLETANRDVLDTTKPIARALVASLLARAEEAGAPGVTGDQRDELVTALQVALGGRPQSIREWGKSVLKRLVLFPLVRRGLRYGRENKRGLFDVHSSKMADILVYQARGKAIRDFILGTVSKAGDDVYVLAHSLGGVACADLFIEQKVPNVRAFITAGSQTPFFYELDALTSLKVSEPLPGHFPQWLNFYDPADFLSFLGEAVFPGKIRDVRVESRQPFPAAHSAYWNNEVVIDEIRKLLGASNSASQ